MARPTAYQRLDRARCDYFPAEPFFPAPHDPGTMAMLMLVVAMLDDTRERLERVEAFVRGGSPAPSPAPGVLAGAALNSEEQGRGM